MSIGPQRPSTSSSNADPRVDELLTQMPTEEVFVKNSSDQMEGTGLKPNSMKIPNTVVGVDESGAFTSFTMSPLAQQVVSTNSEQMMRGFLGIEIPENLSELNNDVGYITADDIPQASGQVNADWNSTTGVSEILNKPVLFDGQYQSLDGIPATFTPAPHTHSISDVTDLQSTLDSKLGVGASIPYASLTNAPSIPSAQIQSDWNQADTNLLDYIKNKPTIPTNTNQLTNGSGFITSAQAATASPVQSVNGQTGAVVINIPTVSYPVVSVNSKTGSVVLTNTDVGAAATSHTHAIADVTGLQAALDAKATTSALTTGLSAKFNTPTGTTSQYIRGDGSLATLPTTSRTFTNPTRTLNTAFQISTTQDSHVVYSVDITVAAVLVAGTSGRVYLEYASDSGFTTGVVAVGSGGQSTGGVLSITNLGTVNLVGIIPAGKYVRLRTANVSGTPTFAMASAQEVLL